MFNIINLSNNKKVEDFIINTKFENKGLLDVVIGNASDIRNDLVVRDNVLYITDDELNGVCYNLVNNLDDSIEILQFLIFILNNDGLINLDIDDIIMFINKKRRIYFNSSSNESIQVATSNLSLSKCDDCIFIVIAKEGLTLLDVNEAVDILKQKIGENSNLLFSTYATKKENCVYTVLT